MHVPTTGAFRRATWITRLRALSRAIKPDLGSRFLDREICQHRIESADEGVPANGGPAEGHRFNLVILDAELVNVEALRDQMIDRPVEVKRLRLVDVAALRRRQPLLQAVEPDVRLLDPILVRHPKASPLDAEPRPPVPARRLCPVARWPQPL